MDTDPNMEIYSVEQVQYWSIYIVCVPEKNNNDRHARSLSTLFTGHFVIVHELYEYHGQHHHHQMTISGCPAVPNRLLQFIQYFN